jgi:DNA-binding beta-propeller fold protein YncE
MRHGRHLLATFAAAAVVASCSSPPSSPAGPAAAESLAPTAAPPTASRPATLGFDGRDAVVVVGREGEDALSAIQASNGDLMALLPAGAPIDPAWGSFATAAVAADGATTAVSDLLVGSGGGASITIDGAWALPTIGDEPIPSGLSADGHTLVLVPAPGDAPATTSRFAIVPFPPIDGVPQLAHRFIELPGALDFDAISPDGRILYVAEHLGPNGGYQVRAVDLPGGAMRPEPIVDKRNIDETMAGWPIGQVRSPGGLVLTLYRGIDHPFVHALNTAEAWAVCIDLPGGGTADADGEWGIAASSDWRSVYAVNATRGLAVDIDPAELVARRTVTLASASLPLVDLAKFGHIDGGPVGRRVVASPDGSAVFAVGTDGVLRLAPDLSVEATLLKGSDVSSIGLLPDGRTLFALLGGDAGGRVLAIDVATGALVGELPGSGYDRLVAVVPWG